MVLNAGKKLLKKIAVIRTIGKQKQNSNTVELLQSNIKSLVATLPISGMK